MRYKTQYPDGSISMGPEYKLNGMYSGSTVDLDLGLQFSFVIGPLMFYSLYTFPIEAFLADSKGLISMDDYHDNDLPPTDFPANYETYATDVVKFAEDSDWVVTDDFSSNRITFGLSYLIGRKWK